MSNRKKRVWIGVLLLAAVGVWVPQLLGWTRESAPPVRPDLPALLDAGAAPVAGSNAAPSAVPAAGAAANPSVVVGATPPAPSANPTQLLGALERGLERLEGSARRTHQSGLDELASSWAPREAPASGGTAPNGPSNANSPNSPNSPSAAPLPLETRPPLYDGAPLDAFLEAHPLRLVLVGETESVARLGQLELRVGEHVLADVEVARIEAGGIVLRTPSGERRVALAPFEPRARTHDGTSAPEAAPAAPAPAPAPAAAPAANAAPASAPPPK